MSFGAANGRGQTNEILLERVVYLTTNLDSLTRTYVERGFAVARGEYTPFGLQRNYVTLPSGQTIELATTLTRDTTDWRYLSLKTYATHLAGVEYVVKNAASLSLRLDSLGIPHGPLIPGRREDGRLYFGFGLERLAPLDITFLSYDDVPFDSVLRPAAVDPINRLRRITWVIPTAGPEAEKYLRSIYAALSLRKQHEGCCDFWLLGPPDHRSGTRFELSTTTFPAEGNWLSIEEGGVIVEY